LFVTFFSGSVSITVAMKGALPANASSLEKLRIRASAAVIVELLPHNLPKKGILYLAYEFVAPQDL
jgi:hypothetical protein